MGTANPRVAILLSTYNGEKFLGEQLDSLLAQSYPDFIIVVRDDGSRDATAEILDRYCAQHPDKFRRVTDDVGNLGACQSYFRLMEYTLANKQSLGLSSAYMAFCDQDDVWDADKLEVTLTRMLATETDPHEPILVHTDLRVVGADLNPVAPSLAEYQGLQPRRSNFGRRLVANSVTGCTVLINEALATFARPFPGQAMMHDWWLALAAGLGGQLVYLERATLAYRQHGGNTLGARRNAGGARTVRSLAGRVLNGEQVRLLWQVALQAQIFKSRYADRLSGGQRMLCVLAGSMALENSLLQKLIYRLTRSL